MLPGLARKFPLCAIALCTGMSFATQAQEAPLPDIMSFAHGTLPVSIDTGAANLKVGIEHAIGIIDGNPGGFVASQKPLAAGDYVEITYELTASTRFDRFAIPNISETPSPSQSFFKTVAVSGSATSADGPFEPLASAELTTHAEPGMETELTMASPRPEVQWLRLRLSEAINGERDKMFLEFSELIGNGRQQVPVMSDRFSGIWKGRGVKLELDQQGATVTGCYDGNAMLSGTVKGNMLRALGRNAAGIESQFLLNVDASGALRGLRSTNGAPFKTYDGDASNAAPKCLPQEPVTLGCGSVIHGIGFDFDSDVIRPSSQVVLDALYAGLVNDGGSTIQIIGHSSSEGSADYNRDLSHRRAQSVAAALVALGWAAIAVSASGHGEDDPIASNDDEAGRSLNRRVEIQCAG